MAVTINGTTGIVTPDITTDSATVDTTTLVVDETNNRVGIGTASPSYPLTVNAEGIGIAVEDTSSGNIGGFYAGNTQTVIEADPSNSVSSSGIMFYVDGSQVGHFNGSTFKFNSGYGSVATAYGCRAWVNFDGRGITTRGSGNVSSITDNATGDYTVNFSTSMPDANYAITGATGTNGNGNPPLTFNTNRIQLSGNHVDSTTSAVRITTDPNAYGDSKYVSVAIFR